MVYNSEYNIRPEVIDIERGIEVFLERDVTVIKTTEIDNKIFVYYIVGNNNRIGSTVLYRGINLKYQIRSAGWGTRNRVLKGKAFESRGKKYLAVMGTNYDLMIDEIDIKTIAGEEFNSKIQGESEILEIFKTEVETYIDEYTLYDKNGRDITADMDRNLTTEKGRSSGKGKAELFMLYVYCVAVLILGFGMASLIKDKDTKNLDT